MKWQVSSSTSVTASSDAATPKVVHINKFDDASVKTLGEAISQAAQEGQQYLPIYIESWGGSVYHLAAMISLLESATIETHTIVCGRAMSAGAMLFCFGKKRFMSENAYLMFHDISAMPHYDKLDSIVVSVKQLDRLRNQIFKKTAKVLGKPANYFEKKRSKLQNQDWYLDSREAKKENIATDIGVPTYKVETKTSYTYTV